MTDVVGFCPSWNGLSWEGFRSEAGFGKIEKIKSGTR